MGLRLGLVLVLVLAWARAMFRVRVWVRIMFRVRAGVRLGLVLVLGFGYH